MDKMPIVNGFVESGVSTRYIFCFSSNPSIKPKTVFLNVTIRA